jgi:hypothetical protein
MIVLSPAAQRILSTASPFRSTPDTAAALGLDSRSLSNADFAQLTAILTAAGFRQRLVNSVLVWIREAQAQPRVLSG